MEPTFGGTHFVRNEHNTSLYDLRNDIYGYHDEDYPYIEFVVFFGDRHRPNPPSRITRLRYADALEDAILLFHNYMVGRKNNRIEQIFPREDEENLLNIYKTLTEILDHFK